MRPVACPPPGDERALLDLATSLVTTPIPRTGPLWRAVFVTGLADGGTAFVVVLRHVLADGIGGLAILTSLADGARPAPVAASRGPHSAAGWRSFRRSMAAGGG
jgi:diacylglycerol O-acyltransferase